MTSELTILLNRYSSALRNEAIIGESETSRMSTYRLSQTRTIEARANLEAAIERLEKANGAAWPYVKDVKGVADLFGAPTVAPATPVG